MPAPTTHKLQLTPEQRQLLTDADAALATAQRDMNLVFKAICAGASITDAALVSLEGLQLTVQVPEQASEIAPAPPTLAP